MHKILDDVFKIGNCAAILLAAGPSVRLGRPKQLLNYKGRSFLQNMLSVAANCRLDPIIVVLGADAKLIRETIDEKQVNVVYNQDWEEGIASSIRCGVRFLDETNPASDAAVLLVCDQPYITSDLINDLITAQQNTGKPMAAAHYDGVTGTPALFHRKFFPELMLLKGDRGAGKILRQHTDLVATIPFPLGTVDIDTNDDYERLKLNI